MTGLIFLLQFVSTEGLISCKIGVESQTESEGGLLLFSSCLSCLISIFFFVVIYQDLFFLFCSISVQGGRAGAGVDSEVGLQRSTRNPPL